MLLSLPVAAALAAGNLRSAGGSPPAYGWGNNASGEVDDGSTTNRSTPVGMVGVDGLATMAIGLSHGLALMPGGTVVSWGHNRSGQLGDGTTTDRPMPGPVSGLAGIAHVAAGDAFSLAVGGDGSVVAWGNNASGQLGDGSAPNDHSTPVAVTGLGAGSGVVAVAAGQAHALALKSDGTVLAWGNNASGQLGDGTAPNDQLTPVTVSGLGSGSGAVAIAAGDSFSMALKSDGTLLAWGNNQSGQLGDGTFPADHATPVAVVGLGSGVARIAAGGSHSLAIKSDGTVLAWGNNQSGQLGDGTAPTDQHTPVVVNGLSKIVDIAAGRSHTVALASDGSVLAWGDNNLGQLGDGTTTRRPTPVAVVSLGSGSGVVAVFAAGDQTHALVAGANAQPAARSSQRTNGAPTARPVTVNPRTAG